MTLYNLLINDKEEMSSFAKKISNDIGNKGVIFLNGQLGAGKTFFASEFIRHKLDCDDNITSPTFSLINTYKKNNIIINHCDFYRIESIDDLLQIGVEDIFKNSISIIEWQRFCDQIVIPDIVIDIEILDEKRRSIKYHFNIDK
jgi:tRNA threonylcarbamoyladenosine biosynthesis protein TsaE